MLTFVLIISALALSGVMIQSLLVKRKSKVKIKVKDERVVEDTLDEEELYRFTVSNDSDQSVVLTAIRLFSEGGEVFDNKHHPGFKAPEREDGSVVDIDSKRIRDISHLLSENFLGTTVVQSGEEVTYSYYLDEPPDEIIITVRENEEMDIRLKVDFE
ncbi:hypothetical protein [Lacicoccus alkaliphilus]